MRGIEERKVVRTGAKSVRKHKRDRWRIRSR